MERPVVHLFRGLIACLVLLLLFSRTRGEEATQNFMNEMKHDEKLCLTPNFLYDSSLAKHCGSTNYPTEELDMRLENMNTFSCLAVYDTSYKLCNYSSHWQNPFDSTAAFNSHIEMAVSDAQKGDKTTFCTSVRGIKPMYEKTKNLVAPLMTYINDDEKCRALCFLSGQLDPLCAMLAWIKKIDEDIQKTISVNTAANVHVSTDARQPPEASEQDKSNIEADPVKGLEPKPKNKAEPKIKAVSDPSYDLPSHNEEGKQSEKSNQPQTPLNNALTNPQNVKEKRPVVGPVLPKSENIDTAAIVSPANLESEAVKNDMDQGPKNNKETPDTSNNLASNVNKGSVPSSIEDTKTSTISQNTQDHIDVAHDYGKLDNNEPYEPDDADQPAETNDQGQNIPEPSEQRDILPRYHNIRPEEESHFFTYFTVISLFGIAGYIGYHNKQKILAIVVEGRRSRNNRGRRRPSTASYRKLDCTLEEAVTSQCNANVTHVIY